MRRSGSTVAGDLGDPRRKKTSGRRSGALPVTWLGGEGVWVNGGARGHVGEARGRLWSRWCSSAHSGSFGRPRGREQRGGEEKWIGQGGRGGAEERQRGVALAGEAGRRAGGVALCPCARVGHTPGRLAPGGRHRWWAGPACWPLGCTVSGCTGKHQVVFFPFCFLFYFSDICFDLKEILNHFIFLCQFL